MTAGPRDQALAYAKHGWRVLPLHCITSGGTCSCGERKPCKQGKHPRISSWPALASSAGADVWEWWEHWPAANVGIATGRASGIWALDIDPDNGGDVTLAAMLAEHGPLPDTRTHRTGSGGTHYLFSCPPDFDVPRTASSVLGKGIDTLGEDSFIVAPPSVSGKGAYTVTGNREPVPAPEWLLRPLREHAGRKAAQATVAAVAGEPVDQAAIHPRLRELLGELKPEDRSEHFWKIVSEAWGRYTQGQVVTLTAPWCLATGKYTGRVETQVAACWAKLGAKHGAGSIAAGPIPAAGHPDDPAAAAELDNGRMKADAGDRNPVDIADGIARHLVARNDPPQLFSMGTTAAQLADGKLRPLDADGWLYYVASRVDFIAGKGSNRPRIVAPPAAVMKLTPPAILPRLPKLDGITTIPYLARDGSLVSQDGYNPQTRLVLHSSVPGVQAAQQPGPEDVAQAVKLLTEDWLGDFPFATLADRAAVIGILLTLTGRAFFSLAPLFVIDASTAGSGKGLIVKTISLIVTGEPGDVMELPADGEEQRKKVTSVLLAGKDLVMWDESHVIAGRTLAAILTAEVYSDRLLGGNKMVSVVNRFTQVALGNNVEVWGDMKRRVVPARLVPDTEHPEHRDDFRHPDLEQWVKHNRGELLAAVLTIWRNWIVKGRPEAATGMGSFDRWARTVGGALEAAGITGFRSNTTTWLSDSEDDDGWHAHLAQLRTQYGTGTFTVAEVTGLIESAVSLMKRPAAIRDDKGKTLGQQLGYAYRKIRDRWHGDLRLVPSAGRSSATGGRTWTVHERGDDRRSEPAQGSSVSSVSSEPQVSAGPTFQQPALTMPDSGASSVAALGSESAGQRYRADHTDDTDDRYGDSERWRDWQPDEIGSGR